MLEHHRKNHLLLQRPELLTNYTLDDIGLSVLHARSAGAHRVLFTFLPLENCRGAPPTDLVFGAGVFQPGFPTFPLPLSFGVPKIGERVTCLGYGSMHLPEGGGISLERVVAGEFDWTREVGLRLKAVEGKVARVFVRRFSSSFVGGPCVVLDCAVEHGQSGGPVINEAGYVCGIVSAGAENFFGQPTTLASLIFPALATSLRFGADIGPLRINAERPLVELVKQGTIASDGSEDLNIFDQDEDGRWRVNPMIHKDEVLKNTAFIHDDFEGFQSGRPATHEP